MKIRHTTTALLLAISGFVGAVPHTVTLNSGNPIAVAAGASVTVPYSYVRPADGAVPNFANVFAVTSRFNVPAGLSVSVAPGAAATAPAGASITCTPAALTAGATALECGFFTSPATAVAVGTYVLGTVTISAPAAAGTSTLTIASTPVVCEDNVGNKLLNACVSSNATVNVTGGGPAAAVTQSPATLAFGASNVGTPTVTSNLVLANTNATAGSATCTISGVNAADFAFFPAVGGGVVAIASGATVNVPVRFTPSGAGARGGSITCVGTTATTVVTGAPTALTGTGNPPPGAVIAQTPATLPFGNSNVGASTATQNVVLTNSVATAGSVNCVIGGANAGNFAFFPAVTFPVAVAANAALSLPVRFTPAAAGASVGSVTCTAVAPATLTGGPTALTGTGVAPVITVVTPPTSSAAAPIQIGTPTFAGTQVGPTSIPVSAPAGNTAPVTLASCSAIASTPAGLFNYGTPAPVFPITIAPGATVNIPVFYNPPAGAPVGVYPGSFTCTTGAGNTPATFEVFVFGTVRAPAVVNLVTQVPTLSTMSIWLLVASMLGFGLVMVGRRQA